MSNFDSDCKYSDWVGDNEDMLLSDFITEGSAKNLLVTMRSNIDATELGSRADAC